MSNARVRPGGGGFLASPYKIGSQDIPYKLRLKIVNFVAINLNYWYFWMKSSDFPPKHVSFEGLLW